MTQKEKRVQILIRLGMSALQAERIIDNLSQPNRPTRIVSSVIEETKDMWPFFGNYTFGVEIECDVNSREFRSHANITGLLISYERYNHNDRTDNTFKCVPDASVRGANAIEVVSPVLKGRDGFSHLKKVCDTLTMANAKVNKSCGLHVHIGNTLNESQRVALLDVYMICERFIDAFMAPSRRRSNNTYCKSIRDLAGDAEFLFDTAAYENIISYGRYYKVNLTSIFTHNTVEFRQHQGSVEYEKISNWVKFCMCLMHYCEDITPANISEKLNRVEICRSVDDLPFLPDALKAYYKQRTEHFANR